MADDFYGFEDEEVEEKGRDNLFLWTIFILLLIGVAFTCWLGSFYIFGHPEKPWCYKVLKKLKKVDAPKRFEVTAAPPGDFLSPQKLFEKYSKYTRLELEAENAELIRNYIKNYRETKKVVPYMTGRFNIINSYELKKGDMFESGVVALAQATDFPQVLVEHVYPTSLAEVPNVRQKMQTGFDMPIVRTNDLSAVIHIEKIYDGRLQFTLVPLLYGTYALKHGVGMFSLEPPADLNLEGGVPVIREPALKDALKAYALYRRTRPAASDEPGPDASPQPTGPELVRVDTVQPGTPVPETGPVAVIPVATPIPLPGKSTPVIAAHTPKPVATPPLVAMLATPVPRPVATPPPVAPPVPAATPPPVASAATPPRVSPTGVELKPFIVESRPAPGTMPPSAGATWRTYPAGQAPAARAITPSEATSLAGRGDLGERIYLRGEFRVTASGENRAVLRDRAAGSDAANPSGAESVRVIVEYPAGAVPPSENATFSRDQNRPFEIRDVRRGGDGQVNIYVREITAAQ
jgi:hypothetical protein